MATAILVRDGGVYVTAGVEVSFRLRCAALYRGAGVADMRQRQTRERGMAHACKPEHTIGFGDGGCEGKTRMPCADVMDEPSIKIVGLHPDNAPWTWLQGARES